MRGQLPTWLADWLDLHASTVGGAAAWELHTTWQWAPWISVLLAATLIVYIAFVYARESTLATTRYRALLAALRLCAVTIVLIMLAQWAFALRLTGPPAIALVIDRSASMQIRDAYAERRHASSASEQLAANEFKDATRLDLLKVLAAENRGGLLASLGERYRVAAYFVANHIERVPNRIENSELAQEIRELSADGPDSHASRLGDAVRRVLDDFHTQPPAAIVMLSDGVNTEGVPLTSAAQEARRRGVPLFTIGLGSDQAPPDIEVADVLVEDAVFVGDAVSIQAQVKASSLSGQPAKVALRKEHAKEPLIIEDIVLASEGDTTTVNLIHRPTEPGDIRYVVEVEPADDEINTHNNRLVRTVAVRDAKIRILLVYGYPSYEFRFLKTLLERDRTVELATFLQDADPGFAAQDKTALRAFPVGREELFGYDVIIVGDVDPRLLPRSMWQHLRAFVTEKGGGVAFIAGPRSFPWLYRDNSDVAALLPIVLDALPGAPQAELPPGIQRGFIARPTALGMQSPNFQLGETAAASKTIWRQLSPLYWLAQIDVLKPAAHVLAEFALSTSAETSRHQAHSATGANEHPTPAFPLICFQYVGAGRVLFHAIDSTWRWRLGAGDVYFGRYWLQTIRFLARSKLNRGQGAELTTDRREYRRSEPVTLRARFLDTSLAPSTGELTVLLSAEGHPRRRATLRRSLVADGVFEGTLTELKSGEYVALLADVKLRGDPPMTRFSVVAPPGELTRTQMDSAALASAAELTGGQYYTIANVDRLLADLPIGRTVPLENMPAISIWNQSWLVAILLVCVISEWVLRKRKGML